MSTLLSWIFRCVTNSILLAEKHILLIHYVLFYDNMENIAKWINHCSFKLRLLCSVPDQGNMLCPSASNFICISLG